MTTISPSKKIMIQHRKPLCYGPILVALIFVILYRILSDQQLNAYLGFGLLSVLVNLIFVSSVAYSNFKVFLLSYGGYSALILSLLVLSIPYSIYFVLISFIVAGFNMPFQT